jgi:hypothetical protein
MGRPELERGSRTLRHNLNDEDDSNETSKPDGLGKTSAIAGELQCRTSELQI